MHKSCGLLSLTLLLFAVLGRLRGYGQAAF